MAENFDDDEFLEVGLEADLRAEIETEEEDLPKVDDEPSEPALEAAEHDYDIEIEGVESPAAQSSDEAAWIKNLRRENKQRAREVAELKALLGQKNVAPVLSPEPTLEGCDHDPDLYRSKLHDWFSQKSKVEQHQAEQSRKEAESAQEWNRQLAAYAEDKRRLNVPNYEQSESTVRDALSELQQSIIVSGCNNPASVIYALSKYPAQLDSIAAISDPVKFTAAVVRLEGKIKMKSSDKTPPKPERRIEARGSVPVSGGSSATLDALRAEAARTGKTDKLMAYKRKLAASKK